VSERDDADRDSEREEHLDTLRIRQATALRRSLYRGRAYAVVGALACAAAAAQCAWLAYGHVHVLGWGARPVALAVLMCGAIVGAAWCARRASALGREARATGLPQPTTVPDFSTLSDGSQRARNLEEVQ
jgi:hypothetical protein